MTEVELRARTALHNPRELARIRLAFGAWLLDYGRGMSMNSAFAAFMREYMAVQYRVSKIHLGEDDAKNYASVISDVMEAMPSVEFRTILLHQLFSLDGTYVGAYITCTENAKTLFWIVVDAEWNTSVIHSGLDAALANLTGRGGYKFITFSIGSDFCVRLLEGTRTYDSHNTTRH